MPSSPARAGTTAVAAVAAAVLMLVLVTWAAAIGPEQVFTGGGTFVRDTTGPIASSSTPESAGPDLQDEIRDKHGAEAPAWVRVLAIVVEIAVLVVLLYLLLRLLLRLRDWWRGRERRRRRPALAVVDFEVLDPTAEVAAAIQEDADEQRGLLEAGEPRNAIVACWRRFEQQAARVSVVRRPWQTSSEFVLGVLDQVGADEGAVLVLAGLFREARFSDHPITEEHRDQALAALATIHLSLGTASTLTARRPT
jgi:hypothetical protein